MSRYSASTIMSSKTTFSLDDYDCIGFDLDYTLCNFNITKMAHHGYDLLGKYLVEEKGYDPNYLLKPLSENYDFLQRGLIMDFSRGNVLRIKPNGYIHKASHGTRFLSDQEIINDYGPDRVWHVTDEYVNDLFSVWNTPIEKEMRACLDFFDLPAVLIFALCIDSLDNKYGGNIPYDVYPDMLQGLTSIFLRDNFKVNKGYYKALKASPENYYNKCDESVLQWLKKLKQKKKMFLITGSSVDFASFTATNSLGEDWKDLFDVVIFFARKPGFFYMNRPLVGIEGIQETIPVEIDYDNARHIYSQGSWKDVDKILSHISGKKSPKCVYIGDNIVQDVYSPSKLNYCDTIAIIEEIYAEKLLIDSNEHHPDTTVLTSKAWGSLFNMDGYVPSLWSKIIHSHAKICIPSLKVIASEPIDKVYTAFSDEDEFSTSGFYPEISFNK